MNKIALAECDHCQWPPKYEVFRGASGSLMSSVCPAHLALAVDKHNHKGNALVRIIP